MANAFWDILVTEEPLAPPHPEFRADAGAVLEFWGVVREREGAGEIAGLTYEAHREMAEHQLQKLAAEAHERFAYVQLILQHRLGFVAAGEPSLFVRVHAVHRAEALQTCEWLIDELKKRVPIWKKAEPAEWRVTGV